MNKKITVALTLVLTIGFGLYLYSSDVFGLTASKVAQQPNEPGGQTDPGNQVDEPIIEVPVEPPKRPYLERTITTNADGLKVVTNPDDLLAVSNKTRNLPADYEPSDLVFLTIPFPFQGDSPIRYLRKDAAEAINQLFAAADKDGIKLVGKSGYRSYAIQKTLFAQNVAAKGEAEANKTSARPGQSEHQTGLAIDVTTTAMGYALKQSFGETEAGLWVKEHAQDYGFIIRYLEGKEDITGYSYEPWHLRYVGIETAKEITAKGLTLEEYLDQKED